MFVGFDVYDRGIACFVKTVEEAHNFIYSEECDCATEDTINLIIEDANNRLLRAIRVRRTEYENEI